MEETRIARNLLFGTDLRPDNLASTDFWPRGPPLLLLKSFQRMRLKKANRGLTYASLEEAESMLVPLGGLQLLPLPELVGMLRILFLLPLPELVGMLPQADLLQWLLPVPQPEPLPEMVGMLPQPDLLQWLLPVPLGGLQLLPLPELVGMLRILFLLPLPELVGMLPQPDLLQWLLPVHQPEPLLEMVVMLPQPDLLQWLLPVSLGGLLVMVSQPELVVMLLLPQRELPL